MITKLYDDQLGYLAYLRFLTKLIEVLAFPNEIDRGVSRVLIKINK